MEKIINLEFCDTAPLEELQKMFFELMTPECRTRERVLEHIRKSLARHIADNSITLEEIAAHIRYTPAELQEQLDGESPINYKSFENFCFSCCINGDEVFPFDSSVPDSKYAELYKKLFNEEYAGGSLPIRDLVRYRFHLDFWKD